MPGLRVITLLSLLYFFAAAAPIATGSDGDAHAIALDVDRNGAVVVPVRVDGAGPFRFLLDTGSTHTSIADTLASRLGLRAVAKAEIVSAAGRVMRRVVALDRTTVGSAARDGILASLLPSAELQQLGAGVQGVLGQDFLSTFDFTIDYRLGRLSWDAGPTGDSPGTGLALTPDAGRFLVELPQDHGRDVLRFVPDSGSASLVVFERGGSGGLPLLRMGGQFRMSGIAGERAVGRAVVPALRVGDVVLRNEPAAVVEWSGYDGGESDGLLPLHRFARVSFRPREGRLLIWGW